MNKIRISHLILWVLAMVIHSSFVFAEDAAVEMPGQAAENTQPAENAKPAADVNPSTEAPSGEYEIDYEEEPDSSSASEGDEAPVEKPAPASGKKAAQKNKPRPASGGGRQTGVLGTHSKNRFAPMMKSDAKSVYKKNGKALDVDAD